MNPMFVPSLALAATGMCRHVRRIAVLESLDCALHGSVGTWEVYGFGGPPDVEAVAAALWRTEPDYGEALDALARGIGLELDEVSLQVDLATAVADRDLGYMRIDAGTVAGLDATWIGSAGSSPVAEMRTVWSLGGIFGHEQTPDWRLLHGYRVRIDGEPNVTLKLSFSPDDFDTFEIGTTTCMPAVNAIPSVVAARPGVLATTDLPFVRARGLHATESSGTPE